MQQPFLKHGDLQEKLIRVQLQAQVSVLHAASKTLVPLQVQQNVLVGGLTLSSLSYTQNKLYENQ